MRNKTKWRSSSGKDRVKEASRKLRAVLKNSRKLCVNPEDVSSLPSAEQLRAACRGVQEPSSWLFLGVLALGVLISALILLMVCGGLSDSALCGKNTTKELQIQTIRLDRLSLDSSPPEGDESTLFNDSEDVDDSHLWQPPHLRLHRER